MPMMNFHTARIVDPGKFDEESFRTKEIADGILAVMGKLKDGDGSMVLQALRFAADKFTAAEAKAWCKEHDYKLLEFAEAKEEDETEAGEEAKPEKHLALVEAIRARKYVGEFGYGVCTADAIVAKAIDEIGVGAVQRYAKLAGSFDREAAVKDASRRLTYCEKDMVAEITATVGSFQDLLPKGMTAPPHTLMLVRNVLTTPRKDRDGDILRSEGAKVDPAGPLLWQHMYNLPIGKHLAVVEQTKEHVKEVNALLDLNELTEDVAKLFEAGALRFSHGFQALDWEEMKNESTQRMDERPSFDIKSFEVLERSAVSIPSCVDAVVELYARGKLCSEPMQRKAKAMFDLRQKVFKGATLDKVATKKDVAAWNKSIAEAIWNIPSQQLESSTLIFDWCSKFCGCEIKLLAEFDEFVSTVRMGSWLTAFDDWKRTSGCTIDDIRNISGQCESPPSYEEILLSSKRKSRFLVTGTVFLHDSQERPIVLTLTRCWYGLEITTRCKRDDLDAVLEIRKWIDDRAVTYKFLKGEKFSLSGEFLEPSGDKFADIFLDTENTKALRMSIELLNSKADKMPCRGVMMLGPPGTGKTLSGRVIMNECPDATFIWVAAKDFYYSGSFGGISGALELARELAPSIVFLEDIDNWMDGCGVDLMKSELDGIARHRGVLTVMTTNYPERMDKALIDRPGRFHDVLMFRLPNTKIRRQMLDTWMPGVDEKQRGDVSQKTDGWSGAHLYELCEFAKSLQEIEQITAGDALTKSLDKIEQQRKLIDSVQLSGSQYLRNRRSIAKSIVPRLRFKTGRVLSQRNMDALGDCLADLDELAGMMPDNMPRGANALMQRVMSRLKEVIESAKPEQERPDAKPKEGENGNGLVETAILGAASEQLRKYQRIIDTELKVRRANAFAAEYRRLTV